jgi:C-methyltransferase C-terminal domain/Putative zinc binding domain/Methyltransferase domain
MMSAVTGSLPPTLQRESCRLCGALVTTTFVDLGMSPLCESFVPPEGFDQMEPFFPLHARVCDGCRLVQLAAFVSPDEIFREYAYFSSYSASWVEHARRYVNEMTERLELGRGSFVVELASNDGYLLRHFLETEIRILGVEPALNVAAAAERLGVPTLTEFFGTELAKAIVEQHGRADLVVGNNVLAQVPDLNDFVAGVAVLLAEGGTATFEFPHLLHLVDGLQYDTIYHEHFSYFSLATATRAMNRHGLGVYDVEEIPTHGGSLRLFVGHEGAHAATGRPDSLARREFESGLDDPRTYVDFAERVRESKRALLRLLIDLRRARKHVVGYGAPGKGNTLLNYCGIRTDFVDYTVDRNPYKHGLQLPGSRIPIFDTTRIAETKPDFVLVLPWNLIDEISAQLSYIAEWGGKLIVPIPTAEIREPGGPR